MRYAGILFLLLFMLVPLAKGAEEGNGSAVSASKTETPTPEKLPPPKNIVDFLSYVTDLSMRFVELEGQIDAPVILSRFQKEISDISNQMQVLSRQVSAASSDGEINYDQLELIKRKAYKLGYRIERVSTPVLKRIENLSTLNTEWVQKKAVLDTWVKIAKQNLSFQLLQEDIITHQRKVDLALEHILKKLNPALAAHKKSVDLEVKIHSLTLDMTKRIQPFRKNGGKVVSIFSVEFYSQMNKQLLETIWKNAIAAAGIQKQLFADQFNFILVLCLAVFILSILIHRSKKIMQASADGYSFTQRPVASAIFLCLAGLTLIDFFNEDAVPLFQGWETMKRIIILVSIVRLSRVLLDVFWKKRFVFQIIMAIMAIEFFKLLNLPQSVFYLYTFFATALILIFCLGQSWYLSRQKISFFGLLGLRFVSLILFGILVLELFGFQDLALYSFNSLLDISIYTVVFWMLLLATKTLLELLLQTTPLAVARKNSVVIVSQLTPVIMLFYSFILFILALQTLGVYPTKEAAMKGFQSFQLAAGFWAVSPGMIVDAAITIYLVSLFSKAIQGLLLQEVLPRYNAAMGVQFSIVRLVNYAMLAIGLILVLHVLGVQLTNLTILGGALGIGVGFGLQAIVNNLASGLILLFERPIKVGDIIQVNNEAGEIKKLGLRATVVQTFDNAEIVIPNSDLVTGQVTNWTLAERLTRVKIPVGVAYGTDITKVLEILMSCADESPMVLSKPSPRALFLSFGESSLDFELRVWIPEFNERLTVLSELNQDINSEFKLAGIEIPFPQRDVHLYETKEGE